MPRAVPSPASVGVLEVTPEYNSLVVNDSMDPSEDRHRLIVHITTLTALPLLRRSTDYLASDTTITNNMIVDSIDFQRTLFAS